MDDKSINRNRLVADDSIFHAFSCQICENVLWKPRSCSSCQKILCEKCIQIWLQNPTNLNKCPFGCELAVYNPCSYTVKSYLSCLVIRCRNETLGCTKTLYHSKLEHHENVECQYRQRLESCIPCPIKCPICQKSFEEIDFQEHQSGCYQRKIDQLNAMVSSGTNSELMFWERLHFFNTSPSNQRSASAFPSFLGYLNGYQQAGEQNCGYILYFSMLLNFLFLNWSKIPSIIYLIAKNGLVLTIPFILDIYYNLSQLIEKYEFRGICYAHFLIFIFTSGILTCIQSFSDQTIILCFTTTCFLLGCLQKVPLKVFEIELHVLGPQIVCTVLSVSNLIVLKLILLLIRFYYSFLPAYISINLIVFLNYHLICILFGIDDEY